MPASFPRMPSSQASLPAASRMASWRPGGSLARRGGKGDPDRLSPRLFQEKGKDPCHRCRLPRAGASRDHTEAFQDGRGRRDPLPVRLPVAARKEPSDPFPQPRNVDSGGRDLRSLPQEANEALLGIPVTIEIEAGPVKNERPPIAGGADDGAFAQRSTPTARDRGSERPSRPRKSSRLQAGPDRGRCPPRPRRGSPGRRQA